MALGVSNICGSFFGTWPAFGSLGRSSVNDSAGTQSQMSVNAFLPVIPIHYVQGAITGTVILATNAFFLSYFYYLPKCVCDSIIVSAAIGLFKIDEIKMIWKLDAMRDLGLLAFTFFVTLFVSIEVGTLSSVGISLLLVVQHSTKVSLGVGVLMLLILR